MNLAFSLIYYMSNFIHMLRFDILMNPLLIGHWGISKYSPDLYNLYYWFRAYKIVFYPSLYGDNNYT